VELIIAGIIGGILLALALAKLIYEVVSHAVDNLLDWVIHTFGNAEAVEKREAAAKDDESE